MNAKNLFTICHRLVLSPQKHMEIANAQHLGDEEKNKCY